MLVTRSNPGAVEPVLRKTFDKADPNLTIISVRTMQEQVALNFDKERAVASLAGLFGRVALLLAAIGLLPSDRLHGRTAHQRDRRVDGFGRRQRKRRSAWCPAARSRKSRSACCSAFRWRSGPAG